MESIKDSVISFDHLYSAMRKCKNEVMWKRSVSGWVKNALVNIFKLKKSLEDDTYSISPYTKFKVHEPKERDIVSTRFKDRVFQRSFCDNYFYDNMTNSFIYDNAACQVGKGNEFARKRLIAHIQKFFRKYGLNGWIFKTDISNFFGSTNHELAKEAVCDRCYDDWALGVADDVIDSYDEGMGLGSEMTQIIELAVLDKLDHHIKEDLRVKHYVRYNDDILLIHEDKEFLKYCWREIDNWLQQRNLKINNKKTQIIPLTQGVKFLGFKYRLTESGKVVMTLLPEKVRHEKRKLRRLVKRAKAGLMTKEDVDICYNSWRSYASNQHEKGSHGKKAHRDTHHLILDMDQYYKNLWKE